MIRKLFVAAALFAAPHMPATAQGFTGNTLLESCTAGENDPMLAICISYISGVRDSLDAMKEGGVTEFGSPSIKLPCIRTAVTNGQIQAVVVKWLNENPRFRDYRAWNIIFFSVAQSFPCNSANG
ncbi:MAG: hypothetical protein EON58_05650 [Alphaproteobacteria bacterium]|nr:MAG: hypothetical protein EON58_05650 [Alphaproteobacteria bacterium]